MSFVRLILIILIMIEKLSSKKPYQLTMLLIPTTVNDQGAECLRASEMVAMNVNNRTDILPDYDIRLDIKYRQMPDYSPPKAGLLFSREFSVERRDTYPAPVIVGPIGSSGCELIGHFLQYINYVVISQLAGSPTLTDRDKYPYVYLTIFANTLTNFSTLMPAMHRMGNWRRFGILAMFQGEKDLAAAKVMEKTLVDNGFEVAWFNALLSSTQFDHDTALSLKQSDARVIVITASEQQAMISFFCQTYFVGITGSRYIFIGPENTFPDPKKTKESSIPIGCSRSIIAEQLKSVYWLSLDTITDENHKCDLGYTKAEFDEQFDKYTNYSSFRTDEYTYRFQCHDSTMHAIKALHNAEILLKAQNLSLRDYYTTPEKVFQEVNRAVLNINYKGLATPNFRYNSKGLSVGVPIFFTHWTPERGLSKVFVQEIVPNATEDIYNFNSYWTRQFEKVNWYTSDGLPPRDRHRVVKILLDPTFGMTFAIIAASALVLAIQAAMAVITIRKRDMMKWSLPTIKIVGLAGCIILDAAAAVNSLPMSLQPLTISFLQIVTITIGASLVSASIAVRTFLHFTAVMKCYEKISKVRFTTDYGFSVPDRKRIMKRTRKMSHSLFLHLQNKAQAMVAVIIAVNIVCLTIWLTINPLHCHFGLLDEPLYDQESDTLFDFYQYSCQSQHQQIWFLLFFSINLFLVMSSAVLAIRLRLRRANFAFPEYRATVTGIMNSVAVLTVGCIALVLIRDPVAAKLVVAVIILLESLVISIASLLTPIRKWIRIGRA